MKNQGTKGGGCCCLASQTCQCGCLKSTGKWTEFKGYRKTSAHHVALVTFHSSWKEKKLCSNSLQSSCWLASFHSESGTFVTCAGGIKKSTSMNRVTCPPCCQAASVLIISNWRTRSFFKDVTPSTICQNAKMEKAIQHSSNDQPAAIDLGVCEWPWVPEISACVKIKSTIKFPACQATLGRDSPLLCLRDGGSSTSNRRPPWDWPISNNRCPDVTGKKICIYGPASLGTPPPPHGYGSV